MKKIIILITSLLLCFGCAPTISNNVANSTDLIRYQDMVELIRSYNDFLPKSEYFNISTDVTKIDDGYRYYVFLDNPRIAMYDVEALVIEQDVDYNKNMAANLGIFESEEYHMVPNQENSELGYISGFSMSAISDKPNIKLYVLVQWKNANRSITNRQYIVLDAVYQGGR